MRVLRGLVVGLSLIGMLVLAGCGVSVGTSPVSTPPVVTTPAGTKAPLHGIVAMNTEGFNSNPALVPNNSLNDPLVNPNVYVASVILVTWNQLQPVNGTAIDTSAIDAGLTAITNYNATHTKQMVGKLRVFAGINTPNWAMNLDGGPVTVPANPYPLPRFWTANYVAAWKNLQNLLAAKYDKDARLGEVAVSGCSSNTAEPFNHPTGVMNIPVLKAAGFTDAQFQNCLNTMGNQYSAWTVTPLDYTFNEFLGIDTGQDVANAPYTIQVMAAWRAGLGTARGVVANHGLQPTLTPAALAIYSEFTVLGPPIEFQAVSPAVNWDQTVALGLSYKASEIEIWQTTQAGGQAVISLAQLQGYAEMF